MLRDLALTFCVLCCLWFSFRRPILGVLTWAWIALMQPYADVSGPISTTLRMNLVVAVTAVLVWLCSSERKLPPFDGIVVAVAALLGWMTINQFFAANPVSSWPFWDQNWRIIALGLIVWATATNKVRMHALILVVSISFLYFGVKTGFITVITGGADKPTGANGMYADNNQFAVALLMTLPMLAYLRGQSANRFVRLAFAGGFVLTIIAVLGTYSRGGFIALSVLALAWWARSARKIRYAIAALAISVPALLLMPQSYYDRLDTLNHTDEDGSFQARITAWKVNYMYASDHFPIGAGFNGTEQPAVFHHYMPTKVVHVAHSIYFQVLGDLGFMGLAIYLAILLLTFRYCSRIRKAALGRRELAWARELATAIQLSMIAFCVGGAALSMPYADMLFLWAGLLPPLLRAVQQAVPEAPRATAPGVAAPGRVFRSPVRNPARSAG